MNQDFRALHTGDVLVLPNAWDAASARLIEVAGAAAIATTSAGLSWSVGARDGGHIDRTEAIAALRRICATVRVPVTADIENGWGDPASAARAVLEAGAVGLNIEDSDAGKLVDVEKHAARIAEVRAVDADLFVNARIDTFLMGAAGLEETLRRAEAFVAAGADGVFVPGIVDEATIGELVRGIDAPLNIMAGPGAPPVARLGELGVARVSVGSAITQAAYALTRRAAQEILTKGTYDELRDGVDYGELNALLPG